MIHRQEGQATFVHECEDRRHSVVVSWGAGYPAVDVNSIPSCPCGGDYERVEACEPGSHECHPIAGHVERSDDHTADLVGDPEKDPDEEELARLRLLKWTLEQKALIANLEGLLAGRQLPELDDAAVRVTLLEARLALKRSEGAAA